MNIWEIGRTIEIDLYEWYNLENWNNHDRKIQQLLYNLIVFISFIYLLNYFMKPISSTLFALGNIVSTIYLLFVHKNVPFTQVSSQKYK